MQSIHLLFNLKLQSHVVFCEEDAYVTSVHHSNDKITNLFPRFFLFFSEFFKFLGLLSHALCQL